MDTKRVRRKSQKCRVDRTCIAVAAKVRYQEVYKPLCDLANRNGTSKNYEIIKAILKHLDWESEEITKYLEDYSMYRVRKKKGETDSPNIMKDIPPELRQGKYF